MPVQLVLMAKDSQGRRVRSGGAAVTVEVRKAWQVQDCISASVQDRGDGSYIAGYVAPSKGNYTVGEPASATLWVLLGQH